MTFDVTLSRRSLLRGALVSLAGLRTIGPSGFGAGDSGTALAATSSGDALGSAPPRWTRLGSSASSPPARRDHSLTLANESGLIYLFGGRRKATRSADPVRRSVVLTLCQLAGV